ncbi:MAG: hypothetical protein HON70_28345, partial [Lentisphaerae bacterium]|nr:hypothetical protein [Lentisphaerota bacterium]
MSMLDILRRNADAIRQAEMGALLHDLDKMDPDFLSVGPTYHDCKDKGKRAGKTVREIKRQRWESMFGNVDPEIRFDGLELPLLSCADPDVTIDPGFPGSLSSAFVYHHHNDRDTFPLLGMICHAGGCGADGIDSELDKDKANEKQSAPFRIDTPFGVLQKEWSSCLKEAIDTVLRGERRPRRFRGLLASALGETRWPCNDVTLWAHSFSVASLFKATLAKILIEVTQGGFTKEHPYLLPRRYDRRRADPPENDTTDFAFFRVTIDRDFMLSRAQKAGDVVGMVDQVERLRDELRDYFEAEVLAGNEIQRTQDSQLFLIPNLGTWIENGECVLPRDVQDRFEEEIKTDLSTFIVKWLMENECHELPFSIDFDHETMPAGNDAKVVSKRLLARSQALQQHIPECRQSVPALLALKPGNGLRCEVCGVRAIAPNPQHKDEALCAPCGKRRHDRDLLKRRNPRDAHFTSDLSLVQPGKGEHNKLVLFHLRFDLASIQDGTVFDKVTWNGNTKAASPGRLHRAYETLAGFLAHCRDEIAPRWCSSPVFSITLEPTPDCMEFIVAGEKADALAGAIYDEYERRFGKFRECLPLSIG